MYYVHINRNVIDSNRKNGTNDAPISIKRGRNRLVGRAFDVMVANGRIRYDAGGILPCGAKVVIETEDEPVILA